MPSDLGNDDTATQALREGLHALSTPAISPDFDVRVLSALQAPAPRWHGWWGPARPLLLSTASSLPLTLLLLHWSLTGPIASPAPAAAPPMLASAPVKMPSLDALLDRQNLCATFLMHDWQMPVPDHRPPPRRHVQALRPPTLAA